MINNSLKEYRARLKLESKEPELALTKDEEIETGKKSALKPIIHDFGKWKMDPQIHGPAQAFIRRPDMTSDHWKDFLQRSHDALTDPSKHISNPTKVTKTSVLVYSKKYQQGVLLRINPKNKDNLKQGGETRVETILPHKHSLAKEGTQRIVIENIEYSLGESLIIID